MLPPFAPRCDPGDHKFEGGRAGTHIEKSPPTATGGGRERKGGEERERGGEEGKEEKERRGRRGGGGRRGPGVEEQHPGSDLMKGDYERKDMFAKCEESLLARRKVFLIVSGEKKRKMWNRFEGAHSFLVTTAFARNRPFLPIRQKGSPILCLFHRYRRVNKDYTCRSSFLGTTE